MSKKLPVSKSIGIYYGYDEDGNYEDEEDTSSQPSMIDMWNKLHPDNTISDSEDRG